MKLFVTGGTGFVGTQTVRRLAERGHEVRCLVRESSRVEPLRAAGCDLVTGDLLDRAALLRGMSGRDAVIHIAAAYSFWVPRRREYTDVNVTGTRNVMECALEVVASKVVHVSSLVVYGKPAERPFTERSAAGPDRFSEYARTKEAGDRVAWELHKSQGLPLVVVYPGGILGPDDPKATGQYVRNLVRRRLPATVFHDSVFPWVHVRDVAEILVRAAEKPGNSGERYFAAAENLTFGEINELIREASGVPLPRLCLSAGLTMSFAALLTALSGLTRRPPPWGMALDQMRTMKEGAFVDGGKAARELGIEYTPIRTAIEQAVASLR
jgi:dihydroflavonol-4-reductase